MIYFCCEEKRRELVRKPGPLNGIDFIEVRHHGVSDDKKQRLLRVHFLKARPSGLTEANVRIEGGERIRNLKVKDPTYPASQPNEVEVEVDQPGDFSRYTLKLVEAGTSKPLSTLDPQLSAVDFSFKVECESEFDCAPVCACPPEIRPEPELDYLAKDYHSFRQLILDRLSLIAPDWRTRNVADLGVTLVELMAYVGDYLSYQQDAVATEAYLGTARQRQSVKRHVRLLDYPMHEGSNARVWIQILLEDTNETKAGVKLFRLLRRTNAGWVPADEDEKLVPSPELHLRLTRFTTSVGSDTVVLPSEPDQLDRLIQEKAPAVFEAMEDAELFYAHNELKFYTWSDDHCCLPRGAIKATLAGHYPDLKPGMVLVLAETIGPRTGSSADADLQHRHPVRLKTVQAWNPEKPQEPLTDPVTNARITNIDWADEDALPFALCLSSVLKSGQHVVDVSVAWGNILLADHGMTLLEAEQLSPVPNPNPALAPVVESACGPCHEQEERLAPMRFQPGLKQLGVTFAEPYVKRNGLGAFLPAASAFDLDPRRAMPAVTLGAGLLWEPQRDLLGSEGFDRNFVVEMDNQDRATIRFGDDINGMQPAAKTQFYALYRVGNGVAGNIGAKSITQISAPGLFDLAGNPLPLSLAEAVKRVTNPLAARGGVEPETLEEVRQYAPQAFRVPRRCVTPKDYADRAAQHPDVQRAAATVRWTGSWHTIFLTVDRRANLAREGTFEAFEGKLRSWLEPFRLAGHDLEINAPQFVSVELVLFVCVAEGYFRADVKRALLDVFSTRQRPDGSRGFFHPDEWTFGQPLLLSKIYAAAQNVIGVRHVEVSVLRRQGSKDTTVPDALTAERLEILRLENDPNFPDHGRIEIRTAGGR